MIFRTLSDRTTDQLISFFESHVACQSIHTFILAYVFQSKGQASVLSLHNPYLAKGAFAHHSKQSEMVQVDYVPMKVSGVPHTQAD